MIETARLRLRAHTADDLAASAQLWGDARVTQHITGRTLSREEVWSRLLRYAGHWQWLRFGYWAVEEKESRQFIGEAGFADYEREMQPSIAGIPEAGYLFAARAHGKGYATEALKSIVAWGDEQFKQARTVCIVSPANTASLRVAKKCGYRELEPATYKGEPTILLERIPA